MHACLLILLHNWKKFQSVALELSPNGEYSLHPKKEYNSSYSGSSIQFQFDHFLEKKKLLIFMILNKQHHGIYFDGSFYKLDKLKIVCL